MGISSDRRRARRLIRQRLSLPQDRPLTVQDLIDAVTAARGGKPIEVVRRRLAPHVTGFCAVRPDRDLVVVDAGAPRFLQIVITCHELFHLLHDDAAPDEPRIDRQTARALMPGIGQDMVDMVLLGRCLEDEDAPDEVEHFAEVGGTELMRLLDLTPGEAGTGSYTFTREISRRPAATRPGPRTRRKPPRGPLVRVWWRDRGDYRRLRVLWETAVEGAGRTVALAPPSRVVERWSPLSAGAWLLIRRLADICDAERALSPWMDPGLAHAIEDAAGPRTKAAEIRALARAAMLLDAVRRRGRGEPPAFDALPRPHDVAPERERTHLVRVARSLDHPLVLAALKRHAAAQCA